MNTAAKNFAQVLTQAWQGQATEEALTPMKVRRSQKLYRTSDCPEAADRVSEHLSVNSEPSNVLVGVNTVNGKLYMIQLFSGSEHGTLGYAFYLVDAWEEIFWLAADASEFAQEFSRAYPRISLYGSVPAGSLKGFMVAATDAGYDPDLGIGDWGDIAGALQKLITANGGTLL